MDKITTLKDLFIEQAQDIYDGEMQQSKALANIIEKITSPELKALIKKHVDETKTQIDRLNSIFKKLNISPVGERCKTMSALIDETSDLIKRCNDPEVLDAGLVTSLQHINHCEIAGYGSVIAYAKTLDMDDLAYIFNQTLEEEKKADLELTKLAESNLNKKARSPILS